MTLKRESSLPVFALSAMTKAGPRSHRGLTGDDHVLVVGRRVGEVVPVLPVATVFFQTWRPVDWSSADMDASPRPMYTLPSPIATPRLGDSGVSPFGNFGRVPDPLPGWRRSPTRCPHVRHVHRALVDDGLLLGEHPESPDLRLEPWKGEVPGPGLLEALDVGRVDVGQRRVPLVVDVPVPSQPIFGARGNGLGSGERRRGNRCCLIPCGCGVPHDETACGDYG